MDFEPSADQEALQDAIRKLCAGRLPLDKLRTLEGGPAVDPGAWQELAETGVFSLRLPEDAGGVGLGTVDAALVYEELGRALVPGPLVATHLAAGLVEGAAGGERVVGAVEVTDGPVLVEHLEALGALVVVGDDRLELVDDPASLAAVAVDDPLDPLTPVHVVEVLPAGGELGGPDDAARWRREGTVLTAALQLGLAQATLDLAVAYAKERRQFDRPIGSFQALKHLLADMLVRTEVARSAVYAAAAHLDERDLRGTDRAVAGARLLAAEAAAANGRSCIQAHGGMGFTWELPAHLYLKRAWVLDTWYGSSDDAAEAVAAAL